MTVFAWKEPPAAAPRQTNWAEVDRELRAKPGEWALVATKPNEKVAGHLATKLRCGYSREGQPRTWHLEPCAFEIERRGCDVYARFVGAA